VKVIFYIISAWTMACGILAISQKNLVHCAVALIGFFGGIAAIFFTLRADFIGAVQIIVYVGAVAVLILFAIMLTRKVTGVETTPTFSQGAVWGWLCGLAIAGILVYAVQNLGGVPLAETPKSLTVEEIGRGFMTRYAIPFEVISLLLTAALIAAVVIALEEPREKQ
jgi:NADH-quinone oxidoreductase subunit J